jgi:hypothetical protein
MLPLLLVTLALDWKAEFCGHTVPHESTTYFAANHIVIEVEVLPDKATPIQLSAGDFRLRINNKKELLAPETPGMVAASMKYTDWNMPTGLQTQGQAGPVILGRPRREPRFPNDPQQDQSNRPASPSGKTDAEAVIDAALPEGQTLGPTKGLVYFRFPGKVKSLKSIEILWGERTLKLR